ncbi:MAG: helical backbone metal receptor [Sphaerochaetaceae bacterium]|nr:helical backbone metal receptor [Sphaerochaetaceae bacterium]
MRIVSLSPNITETVFALGAGNSLVGRTDYCTKPEEALKVRSVGNILEPDTEMIIALKPDIVVASTNLSFSTMTILNRAGINTVRFDGDYTGKDGTFRLLREIGKSINKNAEAEELCQEIEKKLDKIKDVISDIKEKRTCAVIISWGDWGDFVATGDTFINEIIECAGGINFAENAAMWSVSREFLLSQNPDVIILALNTDTDSEKAINSFINTSPYNKLNACREGRVYSIDADIIERQGSSFAESVAIIAKLLYPECF